MDPPTVLTELSGFPATMMQWCNAHQTLLREITVSYVYIHMLRHTIAQVNTIAM